MGDHGTYVNIEENVTEEKLFLIFLNNVYKLLLEINWTPKWHM